MKKALSLVLALILVCGLFPCIHAENKKGHEDLSMLTYKELLAVQSDITAEYKANHTPTDAQTQFVLTSTKTPTQKYYAKKGLEITGWAWYDSEYTYTKDWDFYTLKTHLDYKDSSKKSHKAIIYSEVYYKDSKFVLSYLKTDNTVIIDDRAKYNGVLWFSKPKARINKETSVDLSKYNADELDAFYERVEKQIADTHSVNQGERNTILGYTKLELEQYFLEKSYELSSYAWYDSEYSYIRDWDHYWLETHVDYRTSSNSSKKTAKLSSEFCKINGELELVYLAMGNNIIIDRKPELIVTSENGIPKYSWTGSAGTRSFGMTEESALPESETTYEDDDDDDEDYDEDEETANETQDNPAPRGDGVYLSFADATDEELEEAIKKIRKEQRSRIKTTIVLSNSELTIKKGKKVTLTAEVKDVPEGQKASEITWSTSKKKIATCKNGVVSGKENGKAIITASCTLSDGTKISSECTVSVYTPVSSLKSKASKINLGIGESQKLKVTVEPKDATNTKLKWESTNPKVASVSDNGTVTGVGKGTATITATTTDKTKKSISFVVKVTKKDDRGKTLTNSDGVAVTVLNVKQTKGSGYSMADDGKIFVLIELQIENNSSDSISINSSFGFDAYCDDYSVDYSFSADMNEENGLSLTDLKPGRKIKGWKAFEVPEHWKELIVQFTPNASIWSRGNKIEFVIYNQ